MRHIRSKPIWSEVKVHWLKAWRRVLALRSISSDSLPNATYVGFTGTPIRCDKWVCLGSIVVLIPLTNPVMDWVTFASCMKEGGEGFARKTKDSGNRTLTIRWRQESWGKWIFRSMKGKRRSTQMRTLLGRSWTYSRPSQLISFRHYETSGRRGEHYQGKSMFLLCSTREIAYQLYQEASIKTSLGRSIWFAEKRGAQWKGICGIETMARINYGDWTRSKDDKKDFGRLLARRIIEETGSAV